MKIVDLGHGANAFEPNGSHLDSLQYFDADTLRQNGVSETGIKIYEKIITGGSAGSSQNHVGTSTAPKTSVVD